MVKYLDPPFLHNAVQSIHVEQLVLLSHAHIFGTLLIVSFFFLSVCLWSSHLFALPECIFFGFFNCFPPFFFLLNEVTSNNASS